MSVKILGKGKKVARLRRHARLRKKVVGTPERPRLVVTRSNRHMVAQIVDDTKGHTLVSASTLTAEFAGFEGTKSEAAKKVGLLVAEKAKAAGIEQVVFDRGGNKYTGRVAAVTVSDNEVKETQVAEETQSTAAPENNNNDERKSRRGQRGEGRRGERRNRREENHGDEMLDRVVTINRVSKTHKGGRTFSFAALVVVGDGNGTVGVGYGKSREVPAAIAKGQLDAKKHMFTVPRIRGTVTHPVIGHDAAGTVLLRPAAPGTGVIAGGPVRAVMECAGITDILTKSMGSATAVNMVRATVAALKQLEEPEEIAARRGLALNEVAPDAMLRARAAGIAEAKKAREEAQAKAAAEQKDGE